MISTLAAVRSTPLVTFVLNPGCCTIHSPGDIRSQMIAAVKENALPVNVTAITFSFAIFCPSVRVRFLCKKNITPVSRSRSSHLFQAIYLLFYVWINFTNNGVQVRVHTCERTAKYAHIFTHMTSQACWHKWSNSEICTNIYPWRRPGRVDTSDRTAKYAQIFTHDDVPNVLIQVIEQRNMHKYLPMTTSRACWYKWSNNEMCTNIYPWRRPSRACWYKWSNREICTNIYPWRRPERVDTSDRTAENAQIFTHDDDVPIVLIQVIEQRNMHKYLPMTTSRACWYKWSNSEIWTNIYPYDVPALVDTSGRPAHL